MVAVFLDRGLHDRIDPDQPRVQPLAHPLDRTPLAGRVGTFHHQDHRIFLLAQLELHVQELELVLLELLLVILLVEGFGLVQPVE